MHRIPSRLAACLLTVAVLALAAAPASFAADKDAPRVDINTAGVQELTAVPGVGEAIAARIVEFREKNGPFRRVEDLLKVKGIGEKSLEKIRPHVSVGSSK